MTKARSESDLVEAIARRVVELLRANEPQDRPVRLVDAATLAHELGVERDWVYANSERLGAIRLGGPQGRLRFDREVVAERLGRLAARRFPHQPQRELPMIRQRKRKPQAKVRSPQIQRRASVSAPARSPKQHQTGGSPNDEA